MLATSVRTILITVMLIGVTINLPSECEAQSKTVALGISALSAVYAPLFIAKDAGLFEKYGLDVDVILISAGPIVHGMIAGDVKAAGAGASRIVASNL
jgi:ABC-type nitrate/sulfonate/bicarbonate transport system substrate-binding protein